MQIKHFIKLFLASIILWGCSEDMTSDHEFDLFASSLPDNEMVFEIIANITPMSNHISLKDTLWLSIHMDDSVLTDKISEQKITLPLSESRFIMQMEVSDLIDNKPAKVDVFEKNGKIVEIKDGVITANFGHPDTVAYLDLGFVFEDIGKYALVLYNYPNPYLDNSKSVCEENDCRSVWYDLLFYKDPHSGELLYEAFVEYRFNIGELSTSDSQLNKYTDVSTYSNSIYPVTVR